MTSPRTWLLERTKVSSSVEARGVNPSLDELGREARGGEAPLADGGPFREAPRDGRPQQRRLHTLVKVLLIGERGAAPAGQPRLGGGDPAGQRNVDSFSGE